MGIDGPPAPFASSAGLRLAGGGGGGGVLPFGRSAGLDLTFFPPAPFSSELSGGPLFTVSSQTKHNSII